MLIPQLLYVVYLLSPPTLNTYIRVRYVSICTILVLETLSVPRQVNISHSQQHYICFSE